MPLSHLASIDPAIPEGPTGPVMLLLHGYGSNERDLPGLTPYLPTLPWASVRAPLPMPGGGAAWFPLTLPSEPEQEPIDSATALLWEWVDTHLDPHTPLVPVGFSQGGLMALQLLRTRPERIAATVVLAGLVTDGPQPADARLSEHPAPVFWGRGLADQVIWPAAIERMSALLPTIADLSSHTYPGLGHGVDARMLSDVRTFLDQALAPRD
ncbi:alpha/beta hydrolase [Demequina sp.]|uniref:alpha/beta hydrolase n=1 Tax=Demequina sp. TaxID=2050685 RepID=UPI003A89BE6C